jgi:hypothetical protein
MQAYEALSRTALLLNREFFCGAADERKLVEGLLDSAVRITADQANASTPPGQHLIVTLTSLCARMGMSLELDFPDVPLAAPQPPLRGDRLRTSLSELGDDLIPHLQIGVDRVEADIAFVIGDSPTRDPRALRLFADDWSGELAPASRGGKRMGADLPLGALVAAAMAAAEALRAALPQVASVAALELVPGPHRIRVATKLALDLKPLFPRLSGSAVFDLDSLDFVSGGAITNAAIYVLLRVSGVRGLARVIEDDLLDMSNLNRYKLARRSDVGAVKGRLLEGYGSEALRILGVPVRYEEDHDHVIPLADRVLVGVDHIPSRRAVQRAWPAWLCVAATQGLEVQVSTHRPGEACAGCLHRGDGEDGRDVPTISFVSFWAGFLQALYLLAAVAGSEPAASSITCWPFAEFGPCLLPQPVAPQSDCEVGCPASRRAA